MKSQSQAGTIWTGWFDWAQPSSAKLACMTLAITAFVRGGPRLTEYIQCHPEGGQCHYQVGASIANEWQRHSFIGHAIGDNGNIDERLDADDGQEPATQEPAE